MSEQQTTERAVRLIEHQLDLIRQRMRYCHAQWRKSRKQEMPRSTSFYETSILENKHQGRFLKHLLETLSQA